MLKNFRLERQEGSFTVEAAIIVSTILFIIFLMVFSFMLMYQKSLLTKTAVSVAQQGAEIWIDSRKSIDYGQMTEWRKIGFGENYYQLFGDFGKDLNESINLSQKLPAAVELDENSLRDGKLIKMREKIYRELKRGIMKPASTGMKIDFNNILIERELEVTLTQEVKVPFGRLKAFFGGKDTITLTGVGKAAIAEPAEYIRNIDLAVEYAQNAKEAVDVDALMNKFKNKFLK